MSTNVPVEYLAFKMTIFKRCLFIALIAVSISFLLGQKDFASGLIFGSLISLTIFSLLYKYVLALRGLNLPEKKRFIMPRALLIYMIMGITLFIAIKKGLPVFLGAACGIFSLKIAVFMELFRSRGCQATN
jgi:hypothetical protein